MSLELIYTSAPRGLAASSSGFCTVAATAGMSRQMTMKLESLSGYQFHFGLSDPKSHLNPVNYAHTRLRVGSETFSVLSRIAFCGADHSGRTNKIAHHILLEPGEHSSNGPGWMLMALARGVFVEGWKGDPKPLNKRQLAQIISGERRASEPATTWATLTGDAGWGGALARAFRQSTKVPAFVLFNPGTELLPLFEESLAVLPSGERWEVGFCTYFSSSPPGCQYHWRGILAGSPAAKDMRRFPQTMAIDLTRPLARAGDDEYAEAARTGRTVEPTKPKRAPIRIVERAPEPAPQPSVAAADAEVAAVQQEAYALDAAPAASGPMRWAAATGPSPAQLDALIRRARRAKWVVPLLAASIIFAVSTLAFMALYFHERLQQRTTTMTLPEGPAVSSPDDVAPTAAQDNAAASAVAEPQTTNGAQAAEGDQEAAGATSRHADAENRDREETAADGQPPSTEHAQSEEAKEEPPSPAPEESPPEPRTPQVTIQAQRRDRKEFVPPGLSPERPDPEVGVDGGTVRYPLTPTGTLAFLDVPARLRKRQIVWPGAEDKGITLFCERLDNAISQGKYTLVTCSVEDGPAPAVVWTFDPHTQEREDPYWSRFAWLVIELAGDSAYYQCVSPQRPEKRTERRSVGYDRDGEPMQPKEVTFPYPWRDTLTLMVGNEERLLGQAGTFEWTVDWQRPSGDDKKPSQTRQSKLALEIGPEQHEGGQADQVALTLVLDMPTDVEKEAREAWPTWHEADNKQSKAEVEKPLSALLQAVEQVVKEKGTIEVRDAWGVPVVAVELEFKRCKPDVLIKAAGEPNR